MRTKETVTVTIRQTTTTSVKIEKTEETNRHDAGCITDKALYIPLLCNRIYLNKNTTTPLLVIVFESKANS